MPLKNGQTVRTDALPAMHVVYETRQHERKVLQPEKASERLPLVHIMVGNMKKFVNGTFCGVSPNYLQEYLDEFCHRFKRSFGGPELPLRFLNVCLAHVPIILAEFG